MIYKNCIGTINDDEVTINNHVIKTSHIKAINYFYIPSGKTEFFLITGALFFIITSFFIDFYILFTIGIIGMLLSKVNFYYDYFLVIKTDTSSEPIIEEIKTNQKCDMDTFIEKMHFYKNSNASSL